MAYKLIFKPSAKKDLNRLDNSQAIEVIKKLNKLNDNPKLGKPLGNKCGHDLTGCLKLYACKKKIRIIYSIKNNELIIEVITIEKRDKSHAYVATYRRLDLTR